MIQEIIPAAIPVAAAAGYTAGEVLTFFAAAGVLITGIGAVIVNIIVALRTGAKLDQAAEQRMRLENKVDQVHAVTNSGLSDVKKELANSVTLNQQLREIIADLKSERAKTAAIVAHGPPMQRSQNGRVGDSAAAEQLAQIEVNTKETAANVADVAEALKPEGKK